MGGELRGGNADEGPVLSLLFEVDDSVDLGKKGVVFPHTHVDTRMDSCSPLSDQDIPGSDGLATGPLDPESLPGTVSPVARAATCLLMCHTETSGRKRP